MVAILRMSIAVLCSGVLAMLAYLIFSMFQFGSTPYPSEFEYRGSPSYKYTLVRNGEFTLTMCGQEVCDSSIGNVRSIASISRKKIRKLQAPFSYLPPIKRQDASGRILEKRGGLDPYYYGWKWQVNDVNRLEFIHYRKARMSSCHWWCGPILHDFERSNPSECIEMISGRCLPKT